MVTIAGIGCELVTPTVEHVVVPRRIERADNRMMLHNRVAMMLPNDVALSRDSGRTSRSSASQSRDGELNLLSLAAL